jgi:hypothetical protein
LRTWAISAIFLVRRRMYRRVVAASVWGSASRISFPSAPAQGARGLGDLTLEQQ